MLKANVSGTPGTPFGRRRMCCARTAALQCGNEKQKVNAIRDFAAILAQRPTKAMKMRTTGRQNLARASPEPPEIEAGSTHGSHDVPTRSPRPSQISPKGVHECPRSGQRRPRTDQERPKRGSKPSNMEPDSAPNSILAPSLEYCSSKGSWNSFFSFLRCVGVVCDV